MLISELSKRNDKMEELIMEGELKIKRSVVVKELDDVDTKVESIKISDALLDMLAKEPVCGRSDYSDLPGARRDVRSLWRSYAEYPRRTNRVNSPIRQRGNTAVNSEARHRRNYEARVRREKLTLQRLAKRERLKAQRQERHRQQNLLFKLQQRTPEKGDYLSNPGLIICSPKKGSPGKLWRDNRRVESEHQNRKDSDVSCKKSNCDHVSQNSLSNSQGIHKFSLDNSNDDKKFTFLEQVSSTFAQQADTLIDNTSEYVKFPGPFSKVSNIVDDKNILGDCEENPVTSSCQDSTVKPFRNSSSKSLDDEDESILGTSSKVSSTTAPEIAHADSSTSNTSKRKTRNVKRVNYSELFDDDSDQDEDVEQQCIKESRTSGRKIRPVKRTLEKAIVDAAMKKSPRKRKRILDTDSSNKCSQQSTASLTNTESGTVKHTEHLINMPLPSAAPIANGENGKSNAQLGCRQDQLISNVHSAPVPSSPIHATGIPQEHKLMFLNTSHVTSHAHNPLKSASIPARFPYQINPYQNNMFPSATVACQLSSNPCEQQFYSTPTGYNIPQNQVKPATSLQNYNFVEFRNVNLVTQALFLKPLPVAGPPTYIRNSINSYPTPHISTQNCIISPTFQIQHGNSSIHEINQLAWAPPNFLIESQTSTTASSYKVPQSIGSPQNVIKQVTTNNDREHLDSNAKTHVVSETNRTKNVPSVRNERIHQHASEAHGSNVTLQQQKTTLDVSRDGQQNRILNLHENFLLVPTTNLSQCNSIGNKLSGTEGNNISKDRVDVSLGKTQSRLAVENMLNLIDKSSVDGRNIVKPNNEINKIMQSSEVTSIQNQIMQNSDSQVSYMNGQTVTACPGLQVNAMSIGLPPPLITTSDLCHFPTSVASYKNGQGTSGSISRQDIASHAQYQITNGKIYPAHISYPASMVSERTSHHPDITKQGSVTTTLTSSSSLQKMNSSIHHQSAQSQSAYTKPRHLYLPSHSDQSAFVHGTSSSKLINTPGMPALLGPLNCSSSPRSGKVVYDNNRMPTPELLQTSHIKPIAYSAISSTNVLPVQRATSETIVRGKHQAFPHSRHKLLNQAPNAVRGQNLTPPTRQNFRLIGTLNQKSDLQKQIITTASNIKISAINQPTPTTLQDTNTSSFWRLPLFTNQESIRPISNKSPLDMNYHNQVSQKTPFVVRLQSNQHNIPTKTVQITSEHTGNMTSPTANSHVLYLSSVEEQRGSHLNPQTALGCSSNIPPSVSINKVVINLPYSTDLTTPRLDKNSVSKQTLQESNRVTSVSGDSYAPDVNPLNSRLVHALDLSHKSSQVEQRQQTINTISVTTMSNLRSEQLTTSSNTPRISYDYPLTRSQIKQESMSQPEESEIDNNGFLLPDVQKTNNHTSLRSIATSCKVTVGECSEMSQQNSCPVTSFLGIHSSKQVVTVSQEHVTTNTPLMSTGTMKTSACNVSVMDNINIKVESNLSSKENSTFSSIQSCVSQTPPLTSSPHTFLTALTTSVSSESQVTNISEHIRSIADNTQNSVAVSDPRTSTITPVKNYINSSITYGNIIRTKFPAGVIIKKEVHSDFTAEKLPDTSIPMAQSLYSNNVLASPKRVFLASTSHDDSTSTSDVNKSTVSASSTILSTENNQRVENVQISKNCSHPIFVNDKDIETSFTATKCTTNTGQIDNMSKPHTVIPQILSPQQQQQMSSVHNFPEISKETHVQHMSSSSIPEHSSGASEVLKSASLSTVSLQDGSYSTDPSKEAANAKIAIIIPPVQLSVSPQKQPAIFSPKCLNSNCTNDPLLPWHIDSPTRLNSLSLGDIAGNDTSFTEINNIYTVTVSVPSAEDNGFVHYHTDPSLVDVSAVKVELNTLPASLNQREIIDLSVSDNDEDDPLNIDETSSELSLSQDHKNYTVQKTNHSTSNEASEFIQAVLPALEPTNIQPKTPSSQKYCSSINSEQQETTVTNPERASLISSPGHLKYSAGQVIRSPITGQNVMINDMQINYIRNRLARISSDVSSLTGVTGETCSPVKTPSNDLHSTPPTKDRSFIDSIVRDSESSQMLVTTDSALAVTTCTLDNASKNQEQHIVLTATENDSRETSSATEQHHKLDVKTENFEIICIDDDNDFEESSSNLSSLLSPLSLDFIKEISRSRDLERLPSCSATSKSVVSSGLSTPTCFGTSQQKTHNSGTGSLLTSPSPSANKVLASIADWTAEQVSKWLQNHKLDKICPNLSSLDGPGLQRMALKHQRDPEMFYTRVRQTLGLSFFQTMIICQSMKELYDCSHDES